MFTNLPTPDGAFCNRCGVRHTAKAVTCRKWFALAQVEKVVRAGG